MAPLPAQEDYNIVSQAFPRADSSFDKETIPMPPLRFEQDIRPMFREEDIQEMKDIADFDLSKYEDVQAHAAEIYERVADGSMPCNAPWSDEQIARFKQWMEEGMQR
jgi:hypothetical protein